MSQNRISCSDSECEPLISSTWRNFQCLDLFSYRKLHVYQDNLEFKYWRNVLKRTVPPVTALASGGLKLDFCTSHKQSQNMTPSLQSKYNPKKGHRLYLFSCAFGLSMKLILHSYEHYCWSSWRHHIFSLNADSVTGVYHLDQLTLFITYTKYNGWPTKHFVGFNPSSQCKAVQLTATFLNMLDTPCLYICKLMRTNIWQCNKYVCSIYWPASKE